MICATLDYLKYRLSVGRYSKSSLLRQNAIPLTSELVTSDYGRTGDLLFLHTQESFLSWLVMYYTDSIWSHVAILSDHKTIIDATTAGVIEHPLNDYSDGKTYVQSFRPIAPPELMQQTVGYARAYLGMPFGWLRVLHIFFRVIFGRHHSWRVWHSIDILIVLGVPYLAASSVISCQVLIATIALTYCAVVFANVLLKFLRKSHSPDNVA